MSVTVRSQDASRKSEFLFEGELRFCAVRTMPSSVMVRKLRCSVVSVVNLGGFTSLLPESLGVSTTQMFPKIGGGTVLARFRQQPLSRDAGVDDQTPRLVQSQHLHGLQP